MLDHYVLWRPDPSAIAVDAFMFPLKGKNPYCFPPVTCIPRLLREVLRQQVTVTLVTRLASSLETGSQLASPRTPSPAPKPLDPEQKLDPPPLESDLFQDLRMVLQALGRPDGFIDSVLKCQLKSTYSSQWKHYKLWCLEECRHPWVSLDPNQVSANSARDQLIHFLGHMKPSMQWYNNFCNHKSAIATAFKLVFGFDLGKDVFIVGLEKETATPTLA